MGRQRIWRAILKRQVACSSSTPYILDAYQTTEGLRKAAGVRQDISDSLSLMGHWWGGYTYDTLSGTSTDGPVNFAVSRHLDDGTIVGGGLDAVGPFTIEGRVDDNRRILLRKAYESRS